MGQELPRSPLHFSTSFGSRAISFVETIKGVGEYPPGYNAKVHGPYNPARNYGPLDTKFTDVKLADLGDWLRRRDTRLSGVWRGLNRGFWRWNTKWLHVRSGSTAAVAQWTMVMCFLWYCNQYKWLSYHRLAKYH